MIEAYKKFFKNFTNFSGRSTRSDYWYIVLGYDLFLVVVGLLSVITTPIVNNILGEILEGNQNLILNIILLIFGFISMLILIIFFIYSLSIIIGSFALKTRRMHDINKSGWWQLIELVPIVGPIIFFIFLCTDSVNENNKYGKSVNNIDNNVKKKKNDSEIYNETKKNKNQNNISMILLIIIGVIIMLSAVFAIIINSSIENNNFEQEPVDKRLRARYILVEDYKTAKAIIDLLNSGTDFCELVYDYSEDNSTINECGDLGYFQEGETVIEFEGAVKSLNYNEYTNIPIRSDYGYYVIMRIK
ncbi:MAG: DUF805 domain-containing protein [Bacilli bacterium]|nr:DUF805 domain-containing protein [Bacilli bacterium]